MIRSKAQINEKVEFMPDFDQNLDTDEVVDEGRAYASDQGLDPDREDLEALGAARYVEQIVSGDRDDYALDDVVNYMASSDDFDFEEFKLYKGAMANDYSIFGDKIVDRIRDLKQSKKQYEAKGALFESLYQEVRRERDSAAEAIQVIMGEDIEHVETGGPDAEYPFSVNMGNQVLSELPPRNWNLGNQVVFRSSNVSEAQDHGNRSNDKDPEEWWDEQDTVEFDSI